MLQRRYTTRYGGMIMPKTEFKVGEVFQLGLIHIKVEEAVQVRFEE